MPDFHLVVTQPFGDYAAGDWITDGAIIERVRETHPAHVVQAAAEHNPSAPPADALTADAPIPVHDTHETGEH